MLYEKILVSIAALLLTVAAPLFAGNGIGGKSWNGGGNVSGGLLSAYEEQDLIYMREEEKLARDVYRILFAQWGLAIFSNIANSEQNHTDKIEKLLDTYGIPDPVTDESVLGEFSNDDLNTLYKYLVDYGTNIDATADYALEVGVIIEEIDIRDLQDSIRETDRADILSTYESLLCGSRNHLRAFVKQIEFRSAEIFSAEILDKEEFEEIMNTRTERCGKR
jgi:hypothetical protein